MATIAYIAVHGGAGVHAFKHEKEIKRALRKYVFFLFLSINWNKESFWSFTRACSYALSVTTQTETSNSSRHQGDLENTHNTSLTMVEYAIEVLEDDEHFNAGHFF
jgi:isoaspartyl peptidase/L-asparaginase-like protein (Ntn-hydrolase superfamily)